MSKFEPRIVGLMCHHCSYAGADRAGQSKSPLPTGFLPVRVMCTGRIRPEHIMAALQQGADGVLVLGCHPKDCHYRTGNLRARAAVGLTSRLLEGLGLHPERVQLEWVSAAEGEKLARVVNAQARKLRRLGPFRPASG